MKYSSKETAEKTEMLRVVRDEVFNLKTSPLYEYREKNHYHPVIGEGDHDAALMFIGEAPGRNEAEKGRPFCGASGKILDSLMDSIGLTREKVYITNIIKDRPPENRDPFPDEIALYAPFLDKQIDIIEPKVIATLGRFSMRYILQKFNIPESGQSISSLHGKVFDTEARYGKIKIVPQYHPAASIYNRATLEELKKDFLVLKTLLGT